MGLLTWMFRLLGWGRAASADPAEARSSDGAATGLADAIETTPRLEEVRSVRVTEPSRNGRTKVRRRRIRLTPLRNHPAERRRARRQIELTEVSGRLPYRFARFGSRTGSYLDMSQDADDGQLRARGIPVFATPEGLADWLALPLNKLAWLVHRFSAGKPVSLEKAHYHFTWVKKSSGGMRLIEAPKQTLRRVQTKILREILDRLPAHPAAHGFVAGRSILTNAKPHAQQGVVVKLDLSNFYASVGFARVVAIFRTMGYSREAAIWLGMLTTSAVPGNMPFQGQSLHAMLPYLRRHLPQGAPTSPALANLSAYRLDVRLSGLARSYGATFTRYADDLALSGPAELTRGLRVLLPLVQQIIRQERFRSHPGKRRILRAHQRQSIAGVVVNQKPNISRSQFDLIKAILTNCIRQGPSSQNRQAVSDFASHLRGRIAHVSQLNRARGEKLLALYRQIDWSR